MKKHLLLFLIILPLIGISQNDTIFKKDGKLIICTITYVNDKNIFYMDHKDNGENIELFRVEHYTYNGKTVTCQTAYPFEKNIYSIRKIIFYGYDFSDFQLSDSKRMGQDIKRYLFGLTGFYYDHLPEKKLMKWLKKDSITYNFNPTLLVNKKINNEDIVSPIKHSINKDSLQLFINKYLITEKEGIGYVIIFECFDSYSKSVSAYSVLFDIATKKILLTNYVNNRDGNSYNRISDWNSASFQAIKKLTDLYADKLE